jgi:RNA-directed DNA polymerase
MIDSWKRMSCVPSSAALAASKRPPSHPLLDGLVTDEPWLAALEHFRQRNPRRHDRLAAYQQILDDGAHLRVGAAVLAGTHHPAPPVERWLNKADGRKKRVFQYPPLDELLFRAVNAMLQPTASALASPWCRSFLPGGGARTAFRSVLADSAIDAKAALRFDIRDYFNSIDVADLLGRLPGPLGEGPVAALLHSALLDRRVTRAGAVVDGGAKGVMAGTPLAPLLATLYLRELDHEIASSGATYARYSDDFLVLVPVSDLPELDLLIRRRLAERRLYVNEQKSGVAGPGQPWDFLGFRYHRGAIGLAPMTTRKLTARTTRLARGLLRWRERNCVPAERAVGAFLHRTNLRLYGVPAERADFSWATWFLPMLNGPAGLHPLDHHVQREARFVATGRRTPRTRGLIPYSSLVDAGHLPLVTAYWALHDDAVSFGPLVAARTGLRGRRPDQADASRSDTV